MKVVGNTFKKRKKNPVVDDVTQIKCRERDCLNCDLFSDLPTNKMPA